MAGAQVCENDRTWGPCDCTTCGDGIVDTDEQCDNGINDGAYGGCNPDCTLATHCGDGNADAGFETCDDGADNSDEVADACRTDCSLPRCGDGVVDFLETCDDGVNDGSYGGCMPDCAAAPKCGDGLFEAGVEECDDGAANSDTAADACRTTCTLPGCGDGVIDSAETCDDGDAITNQCDVGEPSCTVCDATCVEAPGTTFLPLPFRVVDAEYSRALERIVMAGASPNALYVYDPATGLYDTISLSPTPTSVSVGLSGDYAAVGHDGWVSYVDLSQTNPVEVFATTADVSDVVLADNGFIYAFPRIDQWETIRCIEIATGTETLSSGYSIRAGTRVKLHPDGTKIYGADNGSSPSDIERYDITGGTASVAYDSPYHGDYPVCGDLWISEDGLRIFTRCGRVFRSSDVQAEDMTYNGSLAVSLITHLDHLAASSTVAVVPDGSSWGADPGADLQVELFDYDFLVSAGSLILPEYPVAATSYPSHGRFVFFRADATALSVIVQADDTSGILNDFAVVTFPL